MLQARPYPFAFAFGNDQVDRVLAEHLVAVPAEELFGLRIPVQDAARLVGLDEGVERGLDDVAGEAFALAQGFLREPGLRHVAADEEEALGLFGPAREPGQPDLVAILVEAAGVGEPGTFAAPQR